MQTKSSLFELSKYETVCLRCARRYRLVDNLGTWQCHQAVADSRVLFVRADHTDDRRNIFYTSPDDDLYFSVEQLKELHTYGALVPTASESHDFYSVHMVEYIREQMVFGQQRRFTRLDVAANTLYNQDQARVGRGYRLVRDYTLRQVGHVVEAVEEVG